MSLLLAGFSAILALFVIIAFAVGAKRSLIVGGITGTVSGFLIGVTTSIAIAAMHWFGPVDIPNPVIQIGAVATTLGNFYPMIFGIVGSIFGVIVTAIRRTNNSS